MDLFTFICSMILQCSKCLLIPLKHHFYCLVIIQIVLQTTQYTRHAIHSHDIYSFGSRFLFLFFFFVDPYIFSVFLFNTVPLQGGFVQAYRAVRRVYHVSWAALPPGKRAQAAVPRKSAERRHRKALGMLTHSFRIKSSWTYRTANLKFNDHSLRDSWIILRI